LFFAAPNTLHVVHHHPDYVVPATRQGTFGHDKNSRAMDALRESGEPMTAHVLDGKRSSFRRQPTHDCRPLLIGGRKGADRFCRPLSVAQHLIFDPSGADGLLSRQVSTNSSRSGTDA